MWGHPRSIERGPVEVSTALLTAVTMTCHPRSIERGPVEVGKQRTLERTARWSIRAQLSAAPLKSRGPAPGGRGRCAIRAQLSAAPLKLVLRPDRSLRLGLHPRSIERGPVEVRLGVECQWRVEIHPRSIERGPVEVSPPAFGAHIPAQSIRAQLSAAPLKFPASLAASPQWGCCKGRRRRGASRRGGS